MDSKTAIFRAPRWAFWFLFLLGVGFIALGIWFAAHPAHLAGLDGAAMMGNSGVGLWLLLPLLVREVRVEPGGVVAEHLLWRRSYSFEQVHEVRVFGRNQRVAQLVLLDGRVVRLGPTKADAEEVARVVRAAWERERERERQNPAPPPAAMPPALDRRLQYVALATLPIAASIAITVWVAAQPIIPDDAVIESAVAIASVNARKSRRGVTIDLIGQDGRRFRLAGPVDISIEPIGVALQADPALPFMLALDRASWKEPWSPLFGNDAITRVYGIERGGTVFLSVEQSRREIARDRKLTWFLPGALALGLLGCVIGIFRPTTRAMSL